MPSKSNKYHNRTNSYDQRSLRNEVIWDLEETYQRKMQAIRDFKKMMSCESYVRSLFIN